VESLNEQYTARNEFINRILVLYITAWQDIQLQRPGWGFTSHPTRNWLFGDVLSSQSLGLVLKN